MLSYEEAVKNIEATPDRPGAEGGFAAVADAFKQLQAKPPHDGLKTVLIAGTNGKGSTAKFLEALIASAGERVGLYVSPHLMQTTERIRVAGRDLDFKQFMFIYDRVRSVCEERGLGRFEALTAMAIEAFFGKSEICGSPVSAAIFEAGVGGRLDCVNAIPRELSVITKIGMDHEAILGNTIEAIAYEKFAIAKSARVCVHGPLSSEAKRSRDRVESEIRSGGGVQTEWIEAPMYSLAAPVYAADGEPRFAIATPWAEVPIALPGERAAENASLAIAAARALGYEPLASRLTPKRGFFDLGSLGAAEWGGRMEALPSSTARGRVYLSGDHNPQGAASLAQLLKHWRYERLFLLVGIGAGKDAQAMLATFESIPRAELFFTTPPFRGAGQEAYARPNRPYDPDCLRALESLERMALVSDLIVVTGSLYLVGALKRQLLDRFKG